MNEPTEPNLWELFAQALEEIVEDLKPLIEKLKAWQEEYEAADPELNRDDIDRPAPLDRNPCHLIPVKKDVFDKHESFNLTKRKTGRR